jgi:Holliday junction resolvase RusA-like endonuclease
VGEIYRGSKIVTFTILGEPISKARARTTSQGGKTWSYNPERSKGYASMITVLMRNKRQLGLIQKIEKPNPVRLRLHFFVSSKATSTPDIVNLAAQIADALEEICYDNDSQIVDLACKKSKSNKPRVLIEVTSAS